MAIRIRVQVQPVKETLRDEAASFNIGTPKKKRSSKNGTRRVSEVTLPSEQPALGFALPRGLSPLPVFARSVKRLRMLPGMTWRDYMPGPITLKDALDEEDPLFPG